MGRGVSFLLFWVLLAAYFSIGIYNAKHVGLTTDEVAHIAAIEGYTKGLGVNVEHPLGQKVFAALYFNMRFSDDDFSSDSDNQYVRGRALLNSEGVRGKALAEIRVLFLLMNGVIFVWLFLYTFVYSFLPRIFTLLLMTFIVFSPSFHAHNFLLTFDTAACMAALMFTISAAHLIYVHQLTPVNDEHVGFRGFIRSRRFQYWGLLYIALVMSLQVKFSNIILLLPYAFLVVWFAVKALGNRNTAELRFLILVNLSGVALGLLVNYFLYAWAFRNVDGLVLYPRFDDTWRPYILYVNVNEWIAARSAFLMNLLKPISFYLQGVLATASRADDTIKGFVYGTLQDGRYTTYALSLFPFKENTVLLPGAIFTFAYGCWQVIKSRLAMKRWLVKFWPALFVVLIYPVIYLIKCFDSGLLIGYRHFYPLLVFIYLAVALGVYKWFAIDRGRIRRYSLVAFACAYSLIGIMAVPQNLSYVNDYWRGDKWMFCGNSSLNWGQEHARAFEFLSRQEDLCRYGVSRVAGRIFKMGTFSQNYEIVTGSSKSCLDTMPFHGARYLIIDSHGLQFLKVMANKDDEKALAYLGFLNHMKPIYSSNDVMWIYRSDVMRDSTYASDELDTKAVESIRKMFSGMLLACKANDRNQFQAIRDNHELSLKGYESIRTTMNADDLTNYWRQMLKRNQFLANNWQANASGFLKRGLPRVRSTPNAPILDLMRHSGYLPKELSLRSVAVTFQSGQYVTMTLMAFEDKWVVMPELNTKFFFNFVPSNQW